MGRTDQRQTELVRLVRVIRVGGDDRAIVAVGAAPLVYRLLDTKPGSVTQFDMEPVEAEHFSASDGPLQADLVPLPLQIYPQAQVISEWALRPIEVLWIAAGSSRYATARVGYYLWQQALWPGGLTPLSLLDARGALASRWASSLRSGAIKGARGIILRS
jgi:hypothetical protein